MPAKTATRPPARTTQSHSHSHRSKGTTSSSSSHSRPAASVGSNLPPILSSARTPSMQQQQQQSVQTPSPNYFGLAPDPASDPRETGMGPKDNWSPPTSSIRSFNPQSPKHVPVDMNPDFEAFKRQAEMNVGFSLGHGNLSHFSTTPGVLGRPRIERQITKAAGREEHAASSRMKAPERAFSSMDIDSESPAAFTNTPQSNTAMSAPSFFDLPRQDSPANIPARSPSPPRNHHRSMLSNLDDRHPRLSLPSNRIDPPSPHLKDRVTHAHHRADTLPTNFDEGPAFISTSELKSMLDRVQDTLYLLLDLRVAPQYAQSRVEGALNLCIPTTLLKRPSFNLDKLTDTFKIDEEKAQFAKWKACEFIVVYDARSSDKKDASSAINTLKKFSNEGWTGKALIVRGGFMELARSHPGMIDHRSSREMHASRKGADGLAMPEVAPVAGGCEMPATKNAANPFFSNIRQNMDLVGGVGQLDLLFPEELARKGADVLPSWLRVASAPENHGKAVSDKFLHIEQEELSRMQKALSSRASYGTPQNDSRSVQIAGFEQGGKNRYNNIWPFEHSRVRLQGRFGSACDYINASHIKATRSNKTYIASQGPLPTTFEDFWSVVWDHDVRVIVMLTAESEGGQLKCHAYWAGKEYGSFKLKTLSEKRVSLIPHKHRHSSRRQSEDPNRRRSNTTSDLATPSPTESGDHPYVIVRKITLSHSGEPFKPMREITQLHYSSWPDFGAPAQPSHLLGLVELSNSAQRGAASALGGKTSKADEPEESETVRPMLVHCSAGCGRTGTFCTVDSVIDMLKRQRKEAQSGVTPMETSHPSWEHAPSQSQQQQHGAHHHGRGGDQHDDYWSANKQSGWRDESRPQTEIQPDDDGGWIFDPTLDLIERTVHDFRGQRISMVQSLRQYVLCYETVLEWVSQQQQQQGQAQQTQSGGGGGGLTRERSGSVGR